MAVILSKGALKGLDVETMLHESGLRLLIFRCSIASYLSHRLCDSDVSAESVLRERYMAGFLDSSHHLCHVSDEIVLVRTCSVVTS